MKPWRRLTALWAIPALIALAPLALAQDQPALQIQLGHRAAVQKLQVTGERVISIDNDALVVFWDLASARQVRTLEGPAGNSSAVAIAPDGKTAAWGRYDKTIRLWDLQTGREVRQLAGHAQTVAALAFSPDGKWLFSTSFDKVAKVWETATGREVRSWQPASGLSLPVFSPDSRTLAAAAEKSVVLWEIPSGRELKTFQAHDTPIRALAFAPGGQNLLSGSEQGFKLWDLQTGQARQAFAGPALAGSVAFSPDGSWFAAPDGDHAIRLWDVASGKAGPVLKGHAKSINTLAFSPDGQSLLSGGEDWSLRQWDPSGQLRQLFEGAYRLADKIEASALSPDGSHFLTWGPETPLRLWGLAPGKVIRTYPLKVLPAAFLPGGQQLLYGAASIADMSEISRTLRLLDLKTGQVLKQFEGHSNWVTAVAVSPDGKQALSGSRDQSVRLWDLATGQLLQTFPGHEDEITAVAFSPDQRLVATGSKDQTLRVWDAGTGQEARPFIGRYTYADHLFFGPGGQTLVSGSAWGEPVSIWDVATGRQRLRLKEAGLRVNTLSFSADGQWLLAGHGTGALTIRDSRTGQLAKTLTGISSPVMSASFSPDGRRILSAHLDNLLRVWDVAREQLLYTTLAAADGETLAWAPDGSFNATPYMQRFLHGVQQLKVVPAGPLLPRFYQPDLAGLGTKPTSADAAILLGQGQPDQAILALDRAILLDAANSGLYFQRGRVYREQGLLRSAKVDFDRALELNPKSGPVLAERGNLLIEQERFDEALPDLEQAIALAPGLWAPWFDRGRVRHFVTQQPDLALADYSQALQLIKDRAVIYLFRSKIYTARHQYAEAIRDLEAARPLEPQWADIVVALGWNYLFTRDFDKSRQYSSQALKLGNQYQQLIALGNLGHAYLFQGQYAKALETYRQGFGYQMEGKTFEELMLEDFGIFRSQKLTHPDMGKVEQFLKGL